MKSFLKITLSALVIAFLAGCGGGGGSSSNSGGTGSGGSGGTGNENVGTAGERVEKLMSVFPDFDANGVAVVYNTMYFYFAPVSDEAALAYNATLTAQNATNNWTIDDSGQDYTYWVRGDFDDYTRIQLDIDLYPNNQNEIYSSFRLYDRTVAYVADIDRVFPNFDAHLSHASSTTLYDGDLSVEFQAYQDLMINSTFTLEDCTGDNVTTFYCSWSNGTETKTFNANIYISGDSNIELTHKVM